MLMILELHVGEGCRKLGFSGDSHGLVEIDAILEFEHPRYRLQE